MTTDSILLMQVHTLVFPEQLPFLFLSFAPPLLFAPDREISAEAKKEGRKGEVFAHGGEKGAEDL